MTTIQEMPSSMRNKFNMKIKYLKNAYLFPKMFTLTLKLRKGDVITARILKIDEKEWKVVITGKTKPGQRFFIAD